MSNEGHDLSEFPNYYGDKEPQGASLEIDPSVFPKDVEKVDLDKLKISNEYRQFIHNGWNGNNNGEYPSNSELVMAVASHLHKWGYEFETFYSICLDVNYRMSRLLMAKHGGNLDNWLWRTWSKVDKEDRDHPTVTKEGKHNQPQKKEENDNQAKITVLKKFSPRPYTERLLEKYNVLFDQYKRLWIYKAETGLWSDNAEIILETELRTKIMAEEALKCYCINEILADVKALSFKPNIADPNTALIPFNNGVYDLDQEELFPYSPEMFFATKISTNYNPEASCPTIDRIFKEIVGPDNIVDLYELTAYCMFRDYPTHKLYFLFGRGSNGKTTYTRILENTLGKNNISSVSLYELQTNRFAGAELFTKYANISSELEYKELKRTTLLKKLSGGDLIRGEHKYKLAFNFHNHAKLVFLTNELPRTIDKTIAFYRRIHLIEFPNVFEGKAEDKLLLSRIAPEEYEGLVAKCVDTLRGMRHRGFFFTNEGSSTDMAVEYERLTNPLNTFLEEETEKDFDGLITKDDLKERFQEWTRQKGYRKWTSTQIGKEMKDRGIESSRRNIETEEGNSFKHCWLGLRWK